MTTREKSLTDKTDKRAKDKADKADKTPKKANSDSSSNEQNTTPPQELKDADKGKDKKKKATRSTTQESESKVIKIKKSHSGKDSEISSGSSGDVQPAAGVTPTPGPTSAPSHVPPPAAGVEEHTSPQKRTRPGVSLARKTIQKGIAKRQSEAVGHLGDLSGIGGEGEGEGEGEGDGDLSSISGFTTLRLKDAEMLKNMKTPQGRTIEAKKMELLADFYSVVVSANITEDDIWNGSQNVLPLLKHFAQELKDAAIYPTSHVHFTFPSSPEFNGIPGKTYKIDRRMPVIKIIEMILARNKVISTADRYTLMTKHGIPLLPQHSLSNYGLGSILENWELKVTDKPSLPQDDSRRGSLDIASRPIQHERRGMMRGFTISEVRPRDVPAPSATPAPTPAPAPEVPKPKPTEENPPPPSYLPAPPPPSYVPAPPTEEDAKKGKKSGKETDQGPPAPGYVPPPPTQTSTHEKTPSHLHARAHSRSHSNTPPKPSTPAPALPTSASTPGGSLKTSSPTTTTPASPSPSPAPPLPSTPSPAIPASLSPVPPSSPSPTSSPAPSSPSNLLPPSLRPGFIRNPTLLGDLPNVDELRYSVLIVFTTDSSVQRVLLPASYKVDHVINLLHEKYASLLDFSVNDIFLKNFAEQILNKDKTLADYGLGKESDRLQLQLFVKNRKVTLRNLLLPSATAAVEIQTEDSVQDAPRKEDGHHPPRTTIPSSVTSLDQPMISRAASVRAHIPVQFQNEMRDLKAELAKAKIELEQIKLSEKELTEKAEKTEKRAQKLRTHMEKEKQELKQKIENEIKENENLKKRVEDLEKEKLEKEGQSEMEKEKEALRKEIEELKKNIAANQSQVQSSEAEVAQLTKQKEEYFQQIQQLSKNENSDQAFQQLQLQFKEEQQTKDELAVQLESAIKQAENYRKQLADMDEQVKKALAINGELLSVGDEGLEKEQNLEDKVSNLQKQNESLKKQIEELSKGQKTEKEDKNKERENFMMRIEDLSGQLDHQAKRFSETEKNLRQKIEDIEKKYQAQIDTLETEKKAKETNFLETKKNLKEEISTLQKEQKTSTEKVVALERKVEDEVVKEKMTELEKRVSEENLREKIKENEIKHEVETKEKLLEKDKQIHELTSKLEAQTKELAERNQQVEDNAKEMEQVKLKVTLMSDTLITKEVTSEAILSPKKSEVEDHLRSLKEILEKSTPHKKGSTPRPFLGQATITPNSTPRDLVGAPSTPMSTPRDSGAPVTPNATPRDFGEPNTPMSTPRDSNTPETPSSTPRDSNSSFDQALRDSLAGLSEQPPNSSTQELRDALTSMISHEISSPTNPQTPNPTPRQSLASPVTPASTPRDPNAPITPIPTPRDEQSPLIPGTPAPTPRDAHTTVTPAPTPRDANATVTPAPTPRDANSTVTPAPTPRDANSTVTPAPTPRAESDTVTPAPTPRDPNTTATPAPTPRDPEIGTAHGLGDLVSKLEKVSEAEKSASLPKVQVPSPDIASQLQKIGTTNEPSPKQPRQSPRVPALVLSPRQAGQPMPTVHETPTTETVTSSIPEKALQEPVPTPKSEGTAPAPGTPSGVDTTPPVESTQTQAKTEVTPSATEIQTKPEPEQTAVTVAEKPPTTPETATSEPPKSASENSTPNSTSTPHVPELSGPSEIIEESKLIRQWAHDVVDFSSEAADDDFDDWSAKQVLGTPKIYGYGDSGLAWAPFETNGGHEWITLKFRKKVYVYEVLILESWHPGAVYKVEVKKENIWDPIWEIVPSAKPEELTIVRAFPKELLKYPADTVRIHLNTADIGQGEWNEIAAVQLAGTAVPGEVYDDSPRHDPNSASDSSALSTSNIKKKPSPPPPPPPPPPSNLLSSVAATSNTHVRISVQQQTMSEEEVAEAMSGLNLFNAISMAKSSLKPVQGDLAFQRPKPVKDDDIKSALQKRFESIQGDDEDNDEWDEWKESGGEGEGGGDGWEDDDEIL